jgi:NAD(P)-dependent dehydrogenase (short-subunit alcohol dehydrogenase family)
MKEVAGSVELDLRFLQMDLQNLRSVKAAAASFRQRETRLDLVINNAGV